MIVKKIATSQKAAPKSKAANVRALADYIAGPGAGGDGEKVEHRGALNLLNIDHDGQVQEMIDLAETAKRSPQPVQHWILSWRENEQPTTAQADEAVRMFLAEMGLAEHQAIYALHRNTNIWHVHVAVNRVNPETEKLVTVNKGFDHEIAHRAIARIEQRQRWEPAPHPLYDVRPDGEIERARPRGQGERQPSARARDFEERAGERSAERIAIEDAAPLVRRARDWRELHALGPSRAPRRARTRPMIWPTVVQALATSSTRSPARRRAHTSTLCPGNLTGRWQQSAAIGGNLARSTTTRDRRRPACGAGDRPSSRRHRDKGRAEVFQSLPTSAASTNSKRSGVRPTTPTPGEGAHQVDGRENGSARGARQPGHDLLSSLCWAEEARADQELLGPSEGFATDPPLPVKRRRLPVNSAGRPFP